jgi:hypothetical protein
VEPAFPALVTQTCWLMIAACICPAGSHRNGSEGPIVVSMVVRGCLVGTGLEGQVMHDQCLEAIACGYCVSVMFGLQQVGQADTAAAVASGGSCSSCSSCGRHRGRGLLLAGHCRQPGPVGFSLCNNVAGHAQSDPQHSASCMHACTQVAQHNTW